MSTNQTTSGIDGVRRSERAQRRRVLALSLMLVAGLFSGVVAGVLLVTPRVDPQADEAMVALREALADQPESKTLKEAVRAQDVRTRAAALEHERRFKLGAVLLLVGVAVTVACAHWYVRIDPPPPAPGDPTDRADSDRWLRTRRGMVTGVAVAGGGVLLAAAMMAGLGGPDVPLSPSPGPDVAPPPVEPGVAYEDDWPRFRGPTGMGIVPAGDWPTEWDGASGEGIAWKTAVPAPGKSSPVIWGNRIFLTGATRDRQDVMAFDRTTGALLWRTRVPIQPRETLDGEEPEELYVTDDTGYAAPTAVTDGERVFAFFATGDVAAVSVDGELAWVRNLGAPENMYGISTSPILNGGRVLIQYDRGQYAEDALSSLIELDPTTGAIERETARPVVNSWGTPVVVDTDSGRQLITSGNPWLIAYNPETMAVVWRAKGLTGDVAPSPVYADGRAWFTNEFARVLCLRTDGTGDVTETGVVWEGDMGMSDASSPVCDGRLFLQAHSSGRVSCYDAETGELLWDIDLPGQFWASPTLVGGTVYLPSAEGRNDEDGVAIPGGMTFIFPLTRGAPEPARVPMGEEIAATPAFADGRIYVRTETSLVCIGKGAE